MNTECNTYSVHSSTDHDSFAASVLELYFTPNLSPFDIARRLNLSLPQLIAFTQREEFQRLVEHVNTFIETRARHVAAAASHHAIQAVADGVHALQQELADHAQGGVATPEADPAPSPDGSLASDPSKHIVPPNGRAKPLHPPKPLDRRRALDSLVRALDRLSRATAHPPRLRLAS